VDETQFSLLAVHKGYGRLSIHGMQVLTRIAAPIRFSPQFVDADASIATHPAQVEKVG
jgi:hypothetical protein